MWLFWLWAGLVVGFLLGRLRTRHRTGDSDVLDAPSDASMWPNRDFPLSVPKEMWEIVCPDELVRHFPYANEGDARQDAFLCDQLDCGTLYGEHGLKEEESVLPKCLGTPHRVRLLKND